MCPDHDDPAYAAANGFGYHEQDAAGLRCPVGAHIRRANPRDSLAPRARHPGVQAKSTDATDCCVEAGSTGPTAVAPSGGEQGLHFLCLNTNLARQYEFVQHSWLNDPSFAGLVGVEDPLIGPRAAGPSSFVEPAAPVRRRYDGLPQFVPIRGGAYFFLPGIRALRYLSSNPPTRFLGRKRHVAMEPDGRLTSWCSGP